MKEVKSERERGSRRRHRDGDGDAVAPAAMVVVKQERLSPEAAPPAHRRPDLSGGSPSPPASEPGRPGPPRDPGPRSQPVMGHMVKEIDEIKYFQLVESVKDGVRSSPVKKKSKSSGRSKSPRTKRSRSPHHSSVRVKQEREDHPRRGREDRQHRDPSEPEHRRARNSERDRHRGHSRQGRSSDERPASAQAQGRDRDSQSLQAQEEEREFYNARRREHRQKNDVSGSGTEAQELAPRPGGNKNKEVPVKEKPSFELSGALLEDTNTFRGVVIKYSEPPEARIPKKRWRLYPFKNDEVLPVMYIHRQSAYLLGRHRRIADIPIDHPSCSKQHAVFQYRLVEHTRADGTVGRRVKPYIIDLGSGNGTFLNNKRIEPQRYYELKEKDVLKFGFSSREYVLLHESSDTSELDRKDDEDEEEEEIVSDS